MVMGQERDVNDWCRGRVLFRARHGSSLDLLSSCVFNRRLWYETRLWRYGDGRAFSKLPKPHSKASLVSDIHSVAASSVGRVCTY